MDRKTIIVVVACIAGMFALNFLSNKLYPPLPAPPQTNVVQAAEAPATTNAATTPTTTPSVATVTPTTTNALPVFSTNAPEQTIVITNENARLVFTSLGGGLKAAELIHYPETVSRRFKNHSSSNGVATLNVHAPAPVLTLAHDSVQGDAVFTLTPTADGVRAEKSLPSGLRVVKEFHVTTNYLVLTRVRLENTGNAPLALPAYECTIGTSTPTGPDDKGESVGLMWFDGAKKQDILKTWFDNPSIMSCVGSPSQPRPEYRAGQSNVVWAASHNQFFAIVAMPPSPVQQVVSRIISLPRYEGIALPPNQPPPPAPSGYVNSFVYNAVTLAPGQAVERDIAFFVGPKEYRTLARVADRFKNQSDEVMGFNQPPFFSIGAFFGKALLLSMNWVHSTFHLGYGLAIIFITVFIKVLFWPLTAASTRSMKRMAALQPQMTALREKYKDDPAKMNKKLMEFMRENKVNPMGGCLPMLLQMPVFFGFFSMIRSAIELRGASFLWVADLSKTDTLFMLPGLGFVPFLGIPGEGLPFNLLPLLMGVTMLWQARMTPPSPGMDPVQQKMMKYMPLMFMLFLYNYSAALTLYWTVQNLLTILQTKLTRSNQPATPTVATSPALTPASKKKK